MAFPSKQPTLFEVFGRSETSALPGINHDAVNSVVSILAEGDPDEGKVVLLKSPRAGYGKTLLLQAVKRRVGEGTRFFAVEPSGGGRVDGEVVLDSVLRQLSAVLPASGGLTEFDFFARRLLACGLRPLLVSGEIPSHDREGALFAIENRPVETFDFHHQQAATAHWTQANFEVLGPRLAAELSEVSQCGLQECAYWLNLLFNYATTAPERVERTRYLTEAVFADLKGLGNSAAEERLQSLLSLLALIQPVVLVFDETEGLSNRPEMGLKVAAFIVQIRQACPGLTVLLSLNNDVWTTGVTPLMPGGLGDRLTEHVVTLEPLNRDEGMTLLKHYFGSDAEQVSQEMEWPDPIYARGILKNGSAIARKIRDEGESNNDRGLTQMPPPLTTVAASGAVASSSFERPDADPVKGKVEAPPVPSEPQQAVVPGSPPEVTEEKPAAITESPATPENGTVEVETKNSLKEQAESNDGAEEESSAAEESPAVSPFESPPTPFQSQPEPTPVEPATPQLVASKSPFSIVEDSPAASQSPFGTVDDNQGPEENSADKNFAGSPATSHSEDPVEEEKGGEESIPSFSNPFAPTASEVESNDIAAKPKDEDPSFKKSTDPVENSLAQAGATLPESPFSKSVTPSGHDDFASPAPQVASEKSDTPAQSRSPFDAIPKDSPKSEPEDPFASAAKPSQSTTSPFETTAEPAPTPSSPFDIGITPASSEESSRTLPQEKPEPAKSPEPEPKPAAVPSVTSASDSSSQQKTGSSEPEKDLGNQEVEDLLNQFKKRFGQPGGSA